MKLSKRFVFHLLHLLLKQKTIDQVDRRLLAQLQRNNRRPLRDLAEDLGVSAPTCLRRIRRLESSGVIRGHAAVLDPASVGLHVAAYIEVSLVSSSGADLKAFERKIQACAQVIQCAEVAGDVDYVLTVVTEDMPQFAEFTRQYLGDDRRVRGYRTHLVLRSTKNEHALPL